MSERQQIEVKVKHLARRKRWQLALDSAMRGLFWGAVLAIVVLLAGKLWILPLGGFAVSPLSGEQSLALILLVAGALAGGTWSLMRKLSLLAVANDVDVRLGLHERVSSALALDPTKVQPQFVAAVVHDAAETVKDLPLRQVYPWGPPQGWQRLAIALLLAAALSFVPQLNWFTRSSDRAEAKLVQESGKKVLELAKEVEKEAEKQKDPELKNIAKQIKRVGEKLNNQQLKKKDALKELQRLKDKLETQARNQAPAGQEGFQAELAKQLKQLASTRELGELMDKQGAQAMLSQMDKVMQDLAQGKISEEQLNQLKDMTQALKEALKQGNQDNAQTQALQEQLEKLDQAIAQAQQAREQLQQALDKFQQDVNELTQNMQQHQMGQQAQQLQQQLQQMQSEMQQQGQLSQESLQQMEQGLEQTMQQIQQMQQNGQLSQQDAQKLAGQCQQCLGQLQGQNGQSGKLGQANQGAQQSNQALGQQAGQCSQCMGQGSQGMGGMLSQQIAELKNQLGQGRLMRRGQASSGWGDGTSPYAVNPAPAKDAQQVGQRQDASKNYEGRDPVDFESLYEGQEHGHAFSQEGQLRGQLDMTKPPQKIDEVRSAPETQEALVGFADVIGSYAEGEENAVQQEQVPQEYRDLVKQYFDQLQKSAKSSKE